MRKNRTKQNRPSFFSTLFHKPLFFFFLIFFLPFLVWGVQQTQQVTSFGKNIYPQSGSFGSIDPIEGYPGGDPAPENHPDLNLSIRGHVPATGEKYPIVLGEAGDPKAPQIGRMLNNRPTIVSLYKIYGWDWASHRKTIPMSDNPVAQVQMIGLSTSPGEEVLVPPAGYEIGGGYNAMILFANDNSITMKYTREDNIGIKNGYAIQIEEINVDQNLLNSYNRLNSSGRGNLPAVSNGQTVGTAKGSEIRVVIRDTGDFLDPRSKLDWWQGIDYPPVPTEVIIPTNFVKPTDAQTVTPTNVIIPTNQPTIFQPSTYNPPPTTYNLQPTTVIPSPTNILIQPTGIQSPVIIVPSIIPSPTPIPKPLILSTIKSNIGNFFTAIWKYTRYILP